MSAAERPSDDRQVRVTVESGIATVTIAHPPVNALAQPVRSALLDEFERLQAQDGVSAIVLTGASGVFVAGADIKEFDAPALAPVLVDVIDRIEAGRKPVVALVAGHALGGGLELALGCHYRIALADARLGLPEVKIGLLPGAGGTQRLPRLVDPGIALDMMLSGEPVDAHRALEIGLVDEVVVDEPGRAMARARRVAGALARSPASLRRIGAITRAASLSPERESAVLGRHQRALRDIPSALRIVECVRASARVPFSDGTAFARRAFEACRTGPVSRALRHLFFSERAANRTIKRGNATPVVIVGKRLPDHDEPDVSGLQALASADPAFDPRQPVDALDRESCTVGYLPFKSGAAATGVVVIARNAQTSAEVLSACVAAARRAGRQSVQVLGPFAAIDARIRIAIEWASDELHRRGVPADAVRSALGRLGLEPDPSTVPLQRSAAGDAQEEGSVDLLVDRLCEAGRGSVRDGLLASCDDFDVLMVHGYGFPRHCGGPVWMGGNTDRDERREMLH